MFGLFSHLLNNIGYLVSITFGLTHIKVFKTIIERENHRLKDKMILSFFFSVIAILGTYVGTDYSGAIANTRNIGVVVAGIMGGPLVGTVTGVAAGLHRYLIDIGGITAFPCSIATALGGFAAGYISVNIDIKSKKIYGLIMGILVENYSMALILVFSRPFYLAKSIVANIYLPMVLANGVGAFIVIAVLENILEEKKKIAGEQAKLILEVANKTLPYFREFCPESITKVCKIIREAADAELVIITDTEKVLASYSEDEKYKGPYKNIRGFGTKKVLAAGETVIIDKLEGELCLDTNIRGLNSAIISPLKREDATIGTIKLFFKEDSFLTSRNKFLVMGLSELISTQLELSRVERLKVEATRAEIKALQAQINPHFLFNALHTVSSFVRMDPDKARRVILDLSTYLRYSIENGDRLVSIEKELEQVKAYVDIEKARFNDKFKVFYDVEMGLENALIPSLTIQPLVENAIKHGILAGNTGGNVSISIYQEDEVVQIAIEDDGVGIDNRVIENIETGNVKPEKIGLYNVHSRIKLIYGKGLHIERLENGTRISFSINRREE